MNDKKVIYKDIPAWDNDQLVQVEDFLPTPDELIYKPKLKKVTLTLSENSINFFKKEAKKNNASYQPMIRNLLDSYVSKMS